MGAAGQEWLDRLDGMVAELEQQWDIRVEQVIEGGSHAFVGLARTHTGEERILKIELPDQPLQAFTSGVEVLRRTNGHSYCRLYQCAPAHRAVLLEKLGGRLKESSFEPKMQMHTICDALLAHWRIPADGLQLTHGSTQWFRTFLPEAWQTQGEPCPRKVLDAALAFLDAADRRADPANWVLLHGDAHNNNMLQVPGTQAYKFIDPDGLLYEKAYDLGVMMREWPDDYAGDPLRLGRERCEYLSALTGVDAQAIWAWGFVQMTATGLLLLQIGLPQPARQMLDIAAAWC